MAQPNFIVSIRLGAAFVVVRDSEAFIGVTRWCSLIRGAADGARCAETWGVTGRSARAATSSRGLASAAAELALALALLVRAMPALLLLLLLLLLATTAVGGSSGGGGELLVSR